MSWGIPPCVCPGESLPVSVLGNPSPLCVLGNPSLCLGKPLPCLCVYQWENERPLPVCMYVREEAAGSSSGVGGGGRPTDSLTGQGLVVGSGHYGAPSVNIRFIYTIGGSSGVGGGGRPTDSLTGQGLVVGSGRGHYGAPSVNIRFCSYFHITYVFLVSLHISPCFFFVFFVFFGGGDKIFCFYMIRDISTIIRIMEIQN